MTWTTLKFMTRLLIRGAFIMYRPRVNTELLGPSTLIKSQKNKVIDSHLWMRLW